MEVDEGITINPEIPLEEQDIDDKTYDILEKMLNRIDPNILAEAEKEDRYDALEVVDLNKSYVEEESESK